MSRLGKAIGALLGKGQELDLSGLFGLRGTASRITVDRLTALEVTAFMCGLRVIAEGLAQMPIEVKRREDDGRSTVLHDHPVARLLERPNAWQSRFEFVEMMGLFCAAFGDFYAFKVVRGDGEVTELLPLPPDACSVRREGWELIYTVGDGERIVGEYGPREILHLRGPSVDTYRGLASYEIAREALGLSKALERQHAELAGNGQRPPGILSSDQPITAAQKEQLNRDWAASFGPGGPGGVAVLDLGMKFSAMSMSSVDAQHIETRQHQVLEVARALRVFPQMLMAEAKGATFASAEQFFRAHVIHTLGPWMGRIEGALKRELLADEPGVVVDFDERRMLRGDFKDQATYYATLLGAGGVSPTMRVNEVRRELGLDPDPDPASDRLAPRLGETKQEADTHA